MRWRAGGAHGDQTWSDETAIEDTVFALAASPDFAADRTVYAARATGLYRSTDGGASWQPAYGSLSLQSDLVTSAVAVSPDFVRDRTVFAGCFRRDRLLLRCRPDVACDHPADPAEHRLLPCLLADLCRRWHRLPRYDGGWRVSVSRSRTELGSVEFRAVRFTCAGIGRVAGFLSRRNGLRGHRDRHLHQQERRTFLAAAAPSRMRRRRSCAWLSRRALRKMASSGPAPTPPGCGCLRIGARHGSGRARRRCGNR